MRSFLKIDTKKRFDDEPMPFVLVVMKPDDCASQYRCKEKIVAYDRR